MTGAALKAARQDERGMTADGLKARVRWMFEDRGLLAPDDLGLIDQWHAAGFDLAICLLQVEHDLKNRGVTSLARSDQDLRKLYATTLAESIKPAKLATGRALAINILRHELADGSTVPARHSLEHARRAGVSKRTWERARRDLHVVATKKAFGGQWMLFLPKRPA